MSSSQTKQDRTLIERIELIFADLVKRISDNLLNLFDLCAILFWYKSSSQTKQDGTLIERIELIHADFVKQVSENLFNLFDLRAILFSLKSFYNSCLKA